MSQLQDLKNRLSQAISGDILDLNDALEGTVLGGAFHSLGVYSDFVLRDKPKVEWEVQDTKLLVKGSISLLRLFQVTVQLSINVDETNGLMADLQVIDSTSGHVHRLKGIPWLACKNAEILMEFSENRNPQLTASIGISVLTGSRWVPFQVAVPGSGQASSFHSILDTNPPLLRDMLPFLGGLRPHVIPVQVDQVDAKLISSSLDYDLEAEQLVGIAAKLEIPKLDFGHNMHVTSGSLEIAVIPDGERLDYKLNYTGTIVLSTGSLVVNGELNEDQWIFKLSIHADNQEEGISLTDLLGQESVADAPGWASSVKIGQLELTVQISDKNQVNYEGNATFKSDIQTSGLQIRLDNLTIAGDQQSLNFRLVAAVEIGELEIGTSIEYANNMWTSLCGEIDVTQLTTISSLRVPNATQAQLCLSNNSSTWKLTAYAEFQVELLANLSIQAKLELDYNEAEAKWKGEICGKLNFHGIEFDVCYTDSMVNLTWNDIELTYSSEREEWACKLNNPNHNLGWLVSEAVSWVEGIRYGLPSPWDALNGISLPDCLITFNFNSRKVSVIFPLDWRLPFASINGFDLTYDPDAREEDTLSFGLKGDFSNLGIEEPRWNPTNLSSAPVLPGVGTSVFDLNLLALGQHVSIKENTVFPNVDDALQALKDVPNNPLKDNTIVYDSSTGWLFATKMKFMRDIDLGLIFNDPKLYALKLSTKESDNPMFSNLEFEIMYQRVTDKIGLYQADITLPDALRYLEFGAYSITLPSFAIGVYTNGDFKLDIGFPHHYDFSRSFTIQTIVPPGIPIIGSAGFYINKLSENTATSVPVTTCGIFNPVLEFGFGMRLGIGKEVHKGPLIAGFSLTVIGMLEGVLASWQPYKKEEGNNNDDKQLAKQFYYALSGTAGIQGRLYGYVDLSIIKASVDVTITIAGQMSYEAYRDLEIAVIAEVDIHVKIKIGSKPFRISINIDYSTQIRETFVIEASGDAPWDDCHSEVRLLSPSNEHAVKPCDRRVRQIDEMNWSNLKSEQKQPLLVYAVPAPAAAQTAEAMQSVYVMLFSIGTMKGLANSNVPDLDVSDFEKLCEKLLQWLVAAADTEPVDDKRQLTSFVTLERIYEIQKYLCGTKKAKIPIPLQAIESFLSEHCELKITAIPENCAQPVGEHPEEAECKETTFFPAIPGLGIRITTLESEEIFLARKFDSVSTANDSYVNQLADYFGTLAVEVEREQKVTRSLFTEAMISPTSIADFVLNDYFVTMARHLIQSVSDVLNDYVSIPSEMEKPVYLMCLEMNAYKYAERGGLPSGSETMNRENIQEIKRCAKELFELNANLPLAQGTLFITGAKHRIAPSEERFETIAANELYRNNSDTTDNTIKFTAADMLRLVSNAANDMLVTPGTYNFKVAEETSKSLVIGEKVSLLSITAYRDSIGMLNATQLLEDYPTLKPLVSAEVEIPRFPYVTTENETLAQVAAKFGVTVRSLAEDQDNLTRQGLFMGAAVRYGRLKRMDMGKLLAETRNYGCYRSLSGMVSRFFLHGMRLHAKSGLTVNDPLLSNRTDYGLFELTGQQFNIPQHEQSFDLTLDAEHVPWVTFI